MKGTGGTGETLGTEIVAVEGRGTAGGATAETGAAVAAGDVPDQTHGTVPRVGTGETDRPSGKGYKAMYIRGVTSFRPDRTKLGSVCFCFVFLCNCF